MSEDAMPGYSRRKSFVITLSELAGSFSRGTFAGLGGWYLGFRDGASTAYADVSSALITYHLAQSRQDLVTAQRVVHRCTGNMVSHLLNGRHQLPLPHVFPCRSEYALSRLRAVWTPPAGLVLAPGWSILTRSEAVSIPLNLRPSGQRTRWNMCAGMRRSEGSGQTLKGFS